MYIKVSILCLDTSFCKFSGVDWISRLQFATFTNACILIYKENFHVKIVII